MIAHLHGVATSFDPAGCGIFDNTGQLTHERFKPDCFDESIRQGGQKLLVNHETFGLRGRFVSIRNDGGVLRFLFHLEEGIHERDVLRRITSGQIARCSIGIDQDQRRSIGRTVEIVRARLVEISLLDGRRPAWYDTWVCAEAV